MRATISEGPREVKGRRAPARQRNTRAAKYRVNEEGEVTVLACTKVYRRFRALAPRESMPFS
jgi:hypothetical protein